MSRVDPKPPLDCYEGDPELLPVSEALRRIDAHVAAIASTEQVALRSALGRVTAEAVISPMDVPGHTNSAMDGYALMGVDLPEQGERRLKVLGTAWAGRSFQGSITPGTCIKIMTGAVIPQGADTVVMQEQVRVDGDTVIVGAGHRRGQNVRQAGEDIVRGAVVLEPGKRIMPAELGMLGSLGIPEVRVKRRLRVAFFSTGDELRSLGQPLEPGEVYDSNRYTLYGMLTRLGVDLVDMGVVRDDADLMREALREASRIADVVITSGGASSGEADYVQEILVELGQVGFWRIAIRPGRPLAFGRIGNAFFFGLPGNPVAVMVTFYQFVQAALERLMGVADAHPMPLVEATCVTSLRKKPGRTEVYRAVLARDAQGKLTVRTTGKSGSGLLHTMSDANCFIILGDDDEPVEPGGVVPVQPFFGLV